MAIASASSLPPRVRRILEAFFAQVAKDLSHRITQMLVDFEQQLFRQADRARSNELQSEHFANLHALRHNRNDLLPRFLEALEAEFAAIREPRKPPSKPSLDEGAYGTLALVAEGDMDQDIVLHEIAHRHEVRSRTGLYLMGQRFGALAGRPAFNAAQLPVGPQALCRALRASALLLPVDLGARLLLYKTFAHRVLAQYDCWIEVLNQSLSQQGVLPELVFAPPRLRRDENASAQRRAGRGQGAAQAGLRGVDNRPLTGWQGQAPAGQWSALGAAADTGPAAAALPAAAAPATMDEAASFAALQQLLSARRAGGRQNAAGPQPGAVSAPAPKTPGVPLSTPLPTQEVLAKLRALQTLPVAAAPGQPHQTVDDLRQTLLAHVRQERGPQAELAQEDADTFELLGMLYTELERGVQHDAPAAGLLAQLQVPVARAALHDRQFFLRARHPARELLNSVAEAGATWMADDERDPVLLQKLRQAVDRVVAEYDGNERVFESANAEVQGHYKAMARKAELAERRHVEAAHGKDRLEVAKHRAEQVIGGAFGERKPPRSVRTLLNQAWADVLTLTLLRNGEESHEWRNCLDVTRCIAAITVADQAAPAAGDAELQHRIENALSQIGYHGDEAAAMARRLSSAEAAHETASGTPLAARLKARAEPGVPAAAPKPPPQPERTPREQECHEYLRTLPFGTWFEFVRHPQGDARRQRLSWFSPITDNALFVNQRGQRIGEQSLDSLARLMAAEQLRVVTEDKGRLIDRAWQATVKALRSIAGAPAPPADGADA
ncbi:MAG TPA: DUF1631 domain-containing protein [Pseudoxanthomonas sp.]|nr:DUF1631 domain-containing protein [Pseudoxanthomonas sp.]